jgi:hypothetical protein
MELSKAEASVGKLEAAWIKWAKITNRFACCLDGLRRWESAVCAP